MNLWKGHKEMFEFHEIFHHEGEQLRANSYLAAAGDLDNVELLNLYFASVHPGRVAIWVEGQTDNHKGSQMPKLVSENLAALS